MKEIDFNYNGVNLEYGRCSCGSVENENIESVNLELISSKICHELGFYKDNKYSEIDLYCINRLLSIYNMYELYNWKIEKSKDYYGEYLEVYFYNDKLEKAISDYTLLTTYQDKIEFVLKLEYGYLLGECHSKIWKIINIDTLDIFIPHREYFSNINNINYDYYDDIVCLCIKDKNNNYKLIDGYHRLKDKYNKKEKNIKILVGV